MIRKMSWHGHSNYRGEDTWPSWVIMLFLLMKSIMIGGGTKNCGRTRDLLKVYYLFDLLLLVECWPGIECNAKVQKGLDYVFYVKEPRRKTFTYFDYILTPSMYGQRLAWKWVWGRSGTRIWLQTVLGIFFLILVSKYSMHFLFLCNGVYDWLGIQDYLKTSSCLILRLHNNPLHSLIITRWSPRCKRLNI